MVVEPFGIMLTNPVAPLLTPLTNDLSGISELVALLFNSIFVKIWISNKCKSHVVVSLEYDASETANEYTLALPIKLPVPAVSELVLLL